MIADFVFLGVFRLFVHGFNRNYVMIFQSLVVGFSGVMNVSFSL